MRLFKRKIIEPPPDGYILIAETREHFREMLARLDLFAFASALAPGEHIHQLRRELGKIAPHYVVGEATRYLRCYCESPNLFDVQMALVHLMAGYLWMDGKNERTVVDSPDPAEEKPDEQASQEQEAGPPGEQAVGTTGTSGQDRDPGQ